MDKEPQPAVQAIDFTVQLWEESGQFVAHAMPIDVMTSGPTPERARLALDEAVLLFLKTVQDHGTLFDVLEESGYTEADGVWKGPTWVGTEHRILRFAA